MAEIFFRYSANDCYIKFDNMGMDEEDIKIITEKN